MQAAPQFPYPRQREAAGTKTHTHEVGDFSRGLFVYSPNGKRWQLKVDNAGTLTVTAA